MSLQNLTKLSLNDFEEFDFTGKTGLSKEQCGKLFLEFVDKHKDNFFFTNILQSVKVSGDLKESSDIKINTPDIIDCIKTALIYIGYTDGNFVWTDYLLICKGNNGIEDGFIYLNIIKEKGIGKIFSALHEEISRFGKITKLDSNLLKMMKRNKYDLIDINQKEYLFGKGHMSAGNAKTMVKRDLDVLFDFMNESKIKASSGDLNPVEFDLNKLRFFKFKKLN